MGTGKGSSGKKMSFHEYTPPAILGMDELTHALSVFPNPAIDVVSIHSNSKEIKSLVIYNAYGKIVSSEVFASTIDVSTYPAGVYYLSGINANGEKIGNQKLIIQ